jgi:cytochrome c biogenesis protein CcmG, thiol:disulfide interchange protein DsbE
MMLVSLGLGAVIAILLIGVVTAVTSTTTTTTLLPTPLVGQRIAPFTKPGLEGGSVTSPWASGHPTVIIFWASFCVPCRDELPRLAAAVGSGSLDNVRVIGVDANDVLASGRAFARQAHVAFPVISDTDGSLTSSTFGFGTIPETVFLSSRGVVRSVVFGAITTHDFRAGVTAIR